MRLEEKDEKERGCVEINEKETEAGTVEPFAVFGPDVLRQMWLLMSYQSPCSALTTTREVGGATCFRHCTIKM